MGKVYDPNFVYQLVTSIPLIGPTKAADLAKLGIATVNDLLHHYPFRYSDARETTNVASATPNVPLTFIGTIISISSVYLRSGKTLQKAVFSDGFTTIPVTWFNQPYLVKSLLPNRPISLFGKIVLYKGKRTIQSPQFEFVSGEEINPVNALVHTGKLVPLYHETGGVSSKWLRSRLHFVLQHLEALPEWLPEELISKYNLVSYDTALRLIHFPESPEDSIKATERLKFDELFLYNLSARIRKQQWAEKHVSHQIELNQEKIEAFIQTLPFALTPSQNQAVTAILTDLKQKVPMNRLLQGEVGSGKTVVAAIAMYASYLSGLPAVLMAPTEILARQHFETIKNLLKPLHLTPTLYTHAETLNPEADLFIIGTHALLFRTLPKELGVVVIDEQHRFGVNQRSTLVKRPTLPNVLSMTATPIPRTLALTLYAELDISYLTDLPFIKPPTKTWLVKESKRTDAYSWIKSQILTNKTQVYVVCPLIEDSTHPQLDQIKAAETTYAGLKKVFQSFTVGLLHGRLKSQEKTIILDQFRQGIIDVLVTTPVIEVGIDIKNANIMVIEGSDRFGLAQLHQLRGRVGRGTDPGYCLLFASNNLASKRLKYLETIHSGNQLAELDLRLRGQGDLYGIRQSGHIQFKLASLNDIELIQQTSNEAVKLVNSHHPSLHLPSLRVRLDSLLEKATEAL